VLSKSLEPNLRRSGLNLGWFLRLLGKKEEKAERQNEEKDKETEAKEIFLAPHLKPPKINRY